MQKVIFKNIYVAVIIIQKMDVHLDNGLEQVASY